MRSAFGTITSAPPKVVRDGKEMPLSLTISRLTEKEEAVASAAPDATKRGRLGVVVEPLTPETARGRGASDKHGVVVRSVQEGSPADVAGIRSGDVITEVNRQPMKSVEDLRRVVEQHQAGSALLLLVTRDGSARYLTVKV
jgi:serine protease Do